MKVKSETNGKGFKVRYESNNEPTTSSYLSKNTKQLNIDFGSPIFATLNFIEVMRSFFKVFFPYCHIM